MDTRMYVYGIHYIAIGRRLFRPKSFSNSFSGLFVTGVSFYDYFETTASRSSQKSAVLHFFAIQSTHFHNQHLMAKH